MAKSMGILDFIMPQNLRCIFCSDEADNYGICDNCYKSLPFIKGRTCRICGGRIDKFDVCNQCVEYAHKYEQNYCVLDYVDEIAMKIIQFKQFHHKIIGNTLAHLMCKYYDNLNLKADIIIPVPIHPQRLKERKFNQSEILVSEIAKKYGNVYTNILTRVKDTPHQTGLSRANRLNNLSDAFEVIDRKKVKGKTILLVDDIYTTGSTLDECASVLYKCGASHVYGLCLARGLVDNKRAEEYLRPFSFRQKLSQNNCLNISKSV